MGISYHHLPQKTYCPNCHKPMTSSHGSSEWNHDAMVCSNACGIRLHKKIEGGMIDPTAYRRNIPMEDAYRVALLRLRIKELEGLLRNREQELAGIDQPTREERLANIRREMKLAIIHRQIEQWVDFAERQGKTDESHIYAPPVWPTLGVLKNWLKALETPTTTNDD